MASNSSRDEDVHLLNQLVGRQLRRARIRRDMTESALAGKVGASIDEILGYEDGSRSPDIARLAELAAILEVPLAQLLGTILESEADIAFDNDEERRDAIRLVRSFGLIDDERIRKSFVDWIEAIAASTRRSGAAASASKADTTASARQSEPTAPATKPDPAGPVGNKLRGRRRK